MKNNTLCCFSLKSKSLKYNTPYSGSNRTKVFWEKVVLRNFAKFTGNHLYQSLIFNKVLGLRPATLIKKRALNMCFPMNFTKFLRTLLQSISGGCFC